MAVTDPFTITYRSRSVGGSTSYQLHGPYTFHKSHERLLLSFDVVVVGTSHDNLQSLSDSLETDFRRRLKHGETLVIDLDGSTWTYTSGTDIFDVTASLSKSGDPATDKGFSRAYSCTIEGSLPADADSGLQELEVLLEYTPSRRKLVTMRGTYTGLSGTNAHAQYTTDFDAEATEYLDFFDSDATWELVAESNTVDRHRDGSNNPFPHSCTFTRQYEQLLLNQSDQTLDDVQIRDHNVSFIDISQHIGDGREGIVKLRRVVGVFECGVNIDETTNIQQIYVQKIIKHVKALFQTIFAPSQFCLEQQQHSYDETDKRIAASFQFLYQPSDGSNVIEISQSVAFREVRHLDFTPVHSGEELAYNVDVGFAVVERIWTRTARVIGDEYAKLRIVGAPKKGEAGLFVDKIGTAAGPDTRNGRKVQRAGWNMVQSSSEISPMWVGSNRSRDKMPTLKITTLSETVVERLSHEPGKPTVAFQRSAATTPGK